MNVNKCCICGNEFERVARHVLESHSLEMETYLLLHAYDGERPTCACGCGDLVEMHASPGNGFCTFVHGHHAKGRKKTDEEKAKIGVKNSLNMTLKYLEGGPIWSKGKYSSSKTGKTCHYRSSWELKYMKKLDSDELVRFWEYEPLYIDYQLDGRAHRYLPDFIVTFTDGRREMHEVGVKSFKESSPICLAKHASAAEWCRKRGMTFMVVSDV